MADMLVGEDGLKSLGIDLHDILAVQVENGKLDAEIDATKMVAGEAAERQNLCLSTVSPSF